jgi:acetyl-CoA acetyltransferase
MDSLKGKFAIVGLGITEMGKIYGRTDEEFAAEAIQIAANDAGLKKDDIDGLLINAGTTHALDPRFQNYIGLSNLSLLNHMNAWGATAIQMVQFAGMAVNAGMANYVACVFSDAPLRETAGAGAAYSRAGRPGGIDTLRPAFGIYGNNATYAMAARRHMALFGTTNNQFGAVAVAQRKWASMNPRAQMKDRPLTIEDYHNSRWICEPLHLFDCTLVSNGGVAVIVTTAERARTLKQPPVYVWGMGQGHPGNLDLREGDRWIYSGGIQSGKQAYEMAGVGPEDIDVRELYDCYTYVVIATLEDYGFCKKGDGGSFVEDGKLGPGGSHPTNTGGGELSSFSMWGMTPLSEAVIQARGQGLERQVKKHDLVIVSGQGGAMDTHSTLILSPVQV